MSTCTHGIYRIEDCICMATNLAQNHISNSDSDSDVCSHSASVHVYENIHARTYTYTYHTYLHNIHVHASSGRHDVKYFQQNYILHTNTDMRVSMYVSVSMYM